MGIREDVVADYEEYLALNKHRWPSELIRALKDHQRLPRFIDNLVKEIRGLDNQTVVAKRQRLFTRKNIKEIVYSLTEHFLTNVKRVADEQHLSDIEKSRIIQKQQDVLDLDRLAKEIIEIDKSKEL